MMASVFVGLGANLGNPLAQAQTAIEAINQLEKTTVEQVSPFYRSKPLGPQNQPDYLNAVLKLNTQLSPLALLTQLQTIELHLGRVRKEERWGARTLDLDILLFDDQVIHNERLTVPHYNMKNREFVLYPLFYIAPDLIFPDKTILLELIKTIPKNGMIRWKE